MAFAARPPTLHDAETQIQSSTPAFGRRFVGAGPAANSVAAGGSQE